MVDAGPDAAARTPRIAFIAGDREARPGRPSPGSEVESLGYGEAFTVRAIDLAPGSSATLIATLWGYESHATFEVGADGTIDTARDAPLDGTYQGVEPEGLVWSMALIEEERGREYGIDVALVQDGFELANAHLDRAPLAVDAEYIEIDEAGLVGTLVVPAGDPRPVVLVLGGSEGGRDTFGAAYYASLGYAAFALAYFGEEGVPQGLTRIPLEYFDGAIDWLEARDDVDASKLAVVGGSRGGELALMLGAEDPRFDLVIANVPSGVRWGSASELAAPAWTKGGEDLPYLDSPPDAEPEYVTMPDGRRATRGTPVFEAALEGPRDAIDRATIEVERSTARFVISAGADDGIWPSCALSRIAMARLEAARGDELRAEAFCFEEAGHIIGSPGWPTGDMSAIEHPRYHELLYTGGTARGTAHAQRALDAAIRRALRDTLGPP